jgi:hypothetical protein
MAGKHRTGQQTSKVRVAVAGATRELVIGAALAVCAIGVAAPASADDPPPVPITPGTHTMTTDTGSFPVTVLLNCGPACFSYGDNSERDEFHWAGDKWLDSKDGISTPDGITFTNRNGFTATVS